MNVFFEQNEKNEKDFDSRTSNSEELIEMIHNKSDFMTNVDKSFLIESVIDSPKETEENKDDDDDNDLILVKKEDKEIDKIKVKKK